MPFIRPLDWEPASRKRRRDVVKRHGEHAIIAELKSGAFTYERFVNFFNGTLNVDLDVEATKKLIVEKVAKGTLNLKDLLAVDTFRVSTLKRTRQTAEVLNEIACDEDILQTPLPIEEDARLEEIKFPEISEDFFEKFRNTETKRIDVSALLQACLHKWLEGGDDVPEDCVGAYQRALGVVRGLMMKDKKYLLINHGYFSKVLELAYRNREKFLSDEDVHRKLKAIFQDEQKSFYQKLEGF